MASFKYLIFITLAVYSVVAEEGARSERHAYIAAAPASVLGYSVSAPKSFSYAYSDYTSYPVAGAIPYHAPVAYPGAVYPATIHSAHAYPSYPEDDGQYWPGKYEKVETPAYKAVYPNYSEDDGQYWPGKYEKVDTSDYKAEHHY